MADDNATSISKLFAFLVKILIIEPALPYILKGYGSQGGGQGGLMVVKVSDHGRHVMSSSPVPLKNPPCRAAMHVKSVES
ncbi:hypothetical protein TNCV_1182231 [Trichonephila clavipes]|nr:hypothetical protein TNCV_1182231 [Trichonephila clavipes]